MRGLHSTGWQTRSIWRLCVILMVFLLFGGAMTASANDRKVVDMADLLTDTEEARLQERLNEIIEKYHCDVAVITTNTCGNKSPQDYTDDYFEQNGYGYGDSVDGIMLMIAMKERKFHLTTMGSAIDIFTDYGLQRIDDLITDDLRDGDYADAFGTFADLAEQFMKEAENGTPYDVNHEYKQPMAMWLRIMITVGAGVVVAVIVVVVLFAQLKSVSPKNTAQEYVKNGSFRVTRSSDLFLYRTVTSRKIERSSGGHGGGGSSTHTTSSGGSAGGHTGSF